MVRCQSQNSRRCSRPRRAIRGRREGSPRRRSRLRKAPSHCKAGSRSGRESSHGRLCLAFVRQSLTDRALLLARMTTLLEPKVTLSYLAYLGYPHSSSWSSLATSHPPSPSATASGSRSYPFSSSGASASTAGGGSGGGGGAGSGSSSSHHDASYQLLPTTSALQVTKPRRPSRRKGVPVERNVFLAYVLGAAGSGKTSLLRAFVGKGFEEDEVYGAKGDWATTRTATGAAVAKTVGGGASGRGKGKSVVNCVEEGGGERYLVVSHGTQRPLARFPKADEIGKRSC